MTNLSRLLRSSLPATTLAALLPFAAGAQTQTPSAPAAAAPAKPATTPAAQPITLPVTVVDKHGDPVKNLTAADLTLTDNGQIQTVQSFTIAPPTTAVIGFIGQTSTGLRNELGDERIAAVHFVDHTLPGTDDKAFVVQFAREVDLLEDPTTAANKLHDAINQLGSPQFGSQNSSSDNSSGDQSTHASGVGGTLNDAIYLAATEVMKKQPGQHILILVSDGVDRDSKESIADAIEAAQATRTMIFAIYYKPEEQQQSNPNQNRRGGMGGPGGGNPGGGGYPGGGGWPGGGGGRRGGGGQAPSSEPHVDGKEILEHLCSATGGYMVEGKKDKAGEAFDKIAALIKTQYALTYTPTQDASQSSLHHITLTSKKNDIWALVQADYAPQ